MENEQIKVKLNETYISFNREQDKSIRIQNDFNEFKEKVSTLIAGILEAYTSQTNSFESVSSLVKKCHVFYQKDEDQGSYVTPQFESKMLHYNTQIQDKEKDNAYQSSNENMTFSNLKYEQVANPKKKY